MNLKIEQETNSSTLYITPEFKPYGIVLFITLLFSSFLVGLYHLIDWIIFGDSTWFGIIFIALFYWMAYINFFNFYWITIGDEEVKVDAESITITKKVKILKHSKKYKKHKISNIELVDTSDNFGAVGTAMFGFSNIHVFFKYGRKKKMIGKQIEKEEGKKILEELKKWGYAT